MGYFEKWVCKIEKLGSYTKLDEFFCMDLCECSYNRWGSYKLLIF